MLAKHRFIQFIQILCYVILYAPFRIFLKLRLQQNSGSANVPLRRVIIANHQSKLDPFLICSALPFKTFAKLTPIFFMTAHKYLDANWKRLLLYPLGCYPVYDSKKKNVAILLHTIELIAQGRTVFAFPEGKITDKKEKPKRGIAYLALRADAAILPAHINGATELTLAEAFLMKRNVRVSIGTFSTAQPNATREQLANSLMEQVYELQFQHGQ